ncbi:MAG: hypothetical protein B0W54_05175 [Cellvibrio sp. 79]|nr:MAG: hypothetical protein B0W54_05175 [Cellvibrio sp. 79]
MNLSAHITLGLLIISLNACVVVPKKVASHDEKCKVAVQKVTLDLIPMESDADWSCTNDYCAWDISSEIASAVFTTTTSAIVSGSVALAGNTLYLLESKGECPGENPTENAAKENQSSTQQQEKTDDRYLIQEEIVTAKS